MEGSGSRRHSKRGGFSSQKPGMPISLSILVVSRRNLASRDCCILLVVLDEEASRLKGENGRF